MLNVLGQTVCEEIKVQVAAPLNVYSHHTPCDGQSGIVASSSCYYLTWGGGVVKHLYYSLDDFYLA